MTRIERTLIISLLSTAFLGVAGGSIAVIDTEQKYDGTCSRLDGLPGILQTAGWVSSGTCQTQNSKNNKSQNPKDPHPDSGGGGGGSNGPCGGSCVVDGKDGTCTNTSKPSGPVVCTCVANISH